MSESAVPSHLPRGVFLGRELDQLSVNGLMLTRSGYLPRALLARHEHEAAFFSVVLSGRYDERLGAQRRVRGPFSVAFHPSGEVHAEEFHPSRSETLGIELSPSSLGRLRDAGVAVETPRLWNGGAPHWIAMRLTRELLASDEASPLAIEGLVLELAAESARAAPTRQAPRWLARVEEQLRASPLRPPSLTVLAETAGVHPVHVARTFRRWHGCTCGEFVRRLRLQRAREHLATSRASLAEIALAAGFSDQSHFARCFRRETGLTPGEYRARIAAR